MLLRSLFARKKQIDASPKLRRIMDMTVPNRPVSNETRGDNRYNRSLPALVCPWDGRSPRVDAHVVGVVQDLSDGGMSVLFQDAPKHKEYLVTLFLSNEEGAEIFQFICEVRDARKFAGNWVLVGFLVTSCADLANIPVADRATLDALAHEQLISQ